MDNKNFITNELTNEPINELTNAEPVVITCRDCNEDFVINPDEQAWYREKNYDLPKRCPACREMRRKMKSAYNSGVRKAITKLISSVIDNGGRGR